MTDLREKVALAIATAPFPQIDKADAAIKAVLEALKEPSAIMWAEGCAVSDALDPNEVWAAMLTAFTRDHYLSALAEEDGKLIE